MGVHDDVTRSSAFAARGALVSGWRGRLGVGLGALLASPLRSFAIPILVAGLLLHAWGMADKHRLDTDGGATQPWWSTALYWICWASLGGLVIAIVMRRIG
jgi:hypothetical protein